MADMRNLWWAAGRLAFSVAENGDWRNRRWADSLRRSATLLEPVWPKTYSYGTFTHALPTIALLLYTGPLTEEPEDVPVEDVPVEEIVAALAPRPLGSSEPTLEDLIRDGLLKRRHDLDDDSQLSALVRELIEYHPPRAYTASGAELSAADHWPGGTLMRAAAQWAFYNCNYHYLERSST